MKKLFAAIMCLMLLTASALPAWAQTSRGRYAARAAQTRRYENWRRPNYDRGYRERSLWDKSRDKLTVVGGAGAGAVVGGLAGGKKGAALGALLGAGGSALYTYKLRDRNERRYDRRH